MTFLGGKPPQKPNCQTPKSEQNSEATVKLRLQEKRFPATGTTGVFPRGAYVLPTCESDRIPISSSQSSNARSLRARALMVGYTVSSHSLTLIGSFSYALRAGFWGDIPQSFSNLPTVQTDTCISCLFLMSICTASRVHR
jgi:hypothetical protein